MALSDLSFKCFTNSSLTVLLGTTKSLVHQTNLSDNPQDFVFYFGSMGSDNAGATDRRVRATSNPGVDNITITPTDILPSWQSLTNYIVGQSIEPTVENGLRYECTTAGTSGSSEPTWPTIGIGSTIADGSVIWTLRGASHQTSEIKLATSQGGLAGASAGAALSLGTSITSGTSNAKTVWVRVTNAVTTVGNNAGTPEIGFYINEIQEEDV